MSDRVILLFKTTQATLQAEETLLENGLSVDVIPRPEDLRGLCGIALEVSGDQLQQTRALLQAGEISFYVYEPAGAVTWRRES